MTLCKLKISMVHVLLVVPSTVIKRAASTIDSTVVHRYLLVTTFVMVLSILSIIIGLSVHRFIRTRQ